MDKAVAFYETALGRVPKKGSMSEGGRPSTEFWLAHERIAGAMGMDPMVPAGVPFRM